MIEQGNKGWEEQVSSSEVVNRAEKATMDDFRDMMDSLLQKEVEFRKENPYTEEQISKATRFNNLTDEELDNLPDGLYDMGMYFTGKGGVKMAVHKFRDLIKNNG